MLSAVFTGYRIPHDGKKCMRHCACPLPICVQKTTFWANMTKPQWIGGREIMGLRALVPNHIPACRSEFSQTRPKPAWKLQQIYATSTEVKGRAKNCKVFSQEISQILLKWQYLGYLLKAPCLGFWKMSKIIDFEQILLRYGQNKQKTLSRKFHKYDFGL